MSTGKEFCAPDRPTTASAAAPILNRPRCMARRGIPVAISR